MVATLCPGGGEEGGMEYGQEDRWAHLMPKLEAAPGGGEACGGARRGAVAGVEGRGVMPWSCASEPVHL